MEQLAHLISELESRIPDHATVNEAVSKAPVGWHLEHSLLVLNRALTALRQSDPSGYRSTFSARRLLLLTFGRIPRGKITSPEAVRPAAGYNAQTLQQHLAVTKDNLQAATALSPDHFFTHPTLGDFRVRTALRFLAIHTAHHLRIIRDILASGKKTA